MTVSLFPCHPAPHRRRAAWSSWWAAQRSLDVDQRFLRTPGFDPLEDDWLRLTSAGIQIGTTGFMAPDGEALDALDDAWPLNGGYFEKQGLWVRGAGPMDWIGSGRGFGRRQRRTLDLRPQTVGLVLARHDERNGFEPMDARGVVMGSGRWTLPGTPHRFNPPATPQDVAWVLERRPRARVNDEHPVFHAFGPAWWTREQIEAVMTMMMDQVRTHLPDGQWIDPTRLPQRWGGRGMNATGRRGLLDRLSDLIDLRDLRSGPGPLLPDAGDVAMLREAGGDRLLDAVTNGWQTWVNRTHKEVVCRN